MCSAGIPVTLVRNRYIRPDISTHTEKDRELLLSPKRRCYFLAYFYKTKAGIMHSRYIAQFTSKVRCLNYSIYSYDWLWYKKRPKNGKCSWTCNSREPHWHTRPWAGGSFCLVLVPLVRYEHANRGTRRGTALIALCMGAGGAEIAQYFLWGPITAYLCCFLICSGCLVTWVKTYS